MLLLLLYSILNLELNYFFIRSNKIWSTVTFLVTLIWSLTVKNVHTARIWFHCVLYRCCHHCDFHDRYCCFCCRVLYRKFQYISYEKKTRQMLLVSNEKNLVGLLINLVRKKLRSVFDQWPMLYVLWSGCAARNLNIELILVCNLKLNINLLA